MLPNPRNGRGNDAAADAADEVRQFKVFRVKNKNFAIQLFLDEVDGLTLVTYFGGMEELFPVKLERHWFDDLYDGNKLACRVCCKKANLLTNNERIILYKQAERDCNIFALQKVLHNFWKRVLRLEKNVGEL
jgi:hypothetical protein